MQSSTILKLLEELPELPSVQVLIPAIAQQKFYSISTI